MILGRLADFVLIVPAAVLMLSTCLGQCSLLLLVSGMHTMQII
jgi:hypothetical protein